ncbi:MAG: transcriptional regulator [Alphaproteobacteria bacterium]|nr:transcriptional regulator [Alphaproteobacteria bacterium]
MCGIGADALFPGPRSASDRVLARCQAVRVFLDFEASSLSDESYPIEVAWVFEDGRGEAHLIRPAPGWEEWSAAAEDIHRIPRAILKAAGMPHDAVARRMVETLAGHDLLATAPSWDGKWLSVLLRAAGLPRRALRLRDTEEAQQEAAERILARVVDPAQLSDAAEQVVTLVGLRRANRAPAHRALADAEEERDRWLDVVAAAEEYAAALRSNR